MDNKDNIILSGSNSDSITVTDTVTLDLDFGAAEPALSTTDYITLDDNLYSGSTITLPSMNYSIAGGGVGGVYTIGNNSNNNYSWATTSSNTVHINSDGIEMAQGADLKIDGKSLKDFMTKMEQRLSILVPNPEKLEKFEALKKAYEHYKTMESLCFPEEKEEKE
jgi:hypothetical protein